ncbi:monovalent cation/H+ antiporter subunit E [Natranaeroarchaeum aerophilus]|uniref:Monovalent cation/H+ antiporter subunit E n=1 Tax=Natranaeroarchaeum aerophilus TaxID=2917711 RepID=A0AAE3FT94_9EURY|nr:monovalent cation/H+ antiporter subunit E [Natranaeroarchaeum aerophilus]
MSTQRVLVPVEESSTLRQTIAYAVESAFDRAGPSGSVELVFVDILAAAVTGPTGESLRSEAESLLDRARIWATEDAGGRPEDLRIETTVLGAEEYLFSPTDYARVIERAATERGIDRVVFDPEYDPGVGQPLLQPLEAALRESGTVTVDEAAVTPDRMQLPLVSAATASKYAGMFVVSFLFYQVLGGLAPIFEFGEFYGTFDLVTGVIAAAVTTVALSQVSFSNSPSLRESPKRLLRWCLYVPYLLVQIIKSNIAIAIVIMRPSMPIDPKMTRMRGAVWGGLPVTTLANSITLTPGTLSVRVQGQKMTVHTLIPDAREDLFDGALERAVRFVFFGRRAMRIESPRDRGDAEVIGGDEE